jgi:L-cysteine:1D-myo-inositol 2-amino-2-deoxy-alpha-D-glucopyranoside ligase
MHVAMVRKDGEKMSKSLGNLVFVDRLRETWDPRAIRLAVLSHAYRVEWDWNDGLMPDATARLALWSGAVGGHRGTVLDRVRERLDDDLDTPGALAEIDAASRAGEDVSSAAALLGVRL